MRIIDGPVAILNEGHPYLKQFPLSIEKAPSGGWRVVWRDFGSTKQEALFDDPVEASNWCAWMNRNCHIIEGWFGASLIDCDIDWQHWDMEAELHKARTLVKYAPLEK